MGQTNAPASSDFVDQWNRAVLFGQIQVAGLTSVPPHKTSHSIGGTDVLTPSDIGAQPFGNYVLDSDPRLTNSRSPTAHASSHKNGGSDEVAVDASASYAIPKALATGKLDIGWFPTGTTSTSLCVGNDARLNIGYTFSQTHTSTSNAGTSDATFYFGVPNSGTATTTITARAFAFLQTGTIWGAVSTLSCTAATGTKTATTASVHLWDRTANASAGDLGLTHNYANAIDVQRNTSVNGGTGISVSTSTTYAIRVVIPGYSTANATSLVHAVTLFIR